MRADVLITCQSGVWARGGGIKHPEAKKDEGSWIQAPNYGSKHGNVVTV